MTPTSGLTFSLLSHPVVIAFYHDHGIDIRDRSIWEFATFGTEYEEIRDTDPFRAHATFRVDDEKLTVVVDEELSVVDSTVAAVEDV